MKTYHDDPPHKLQSESYTGPMTIERFRTMEEIKICNEGKTDRIA
jgi:arylsulfatase